MSIHHHLDAATLMRYASGDLDTAFTVVVASHLAMCDACRESVRVAEAMGGQCLDDAPAPMLSDGAFARLSHAIDAGVTRDTPVVPRAREIGSQHASDVPLPLRPFVGDTFDDVSWRMIVPGVHRHRIELADTQSSLYMLKIGEGRKMPEHGHGGPEMTLVMRGSYSDTLGHYGAGDVADLDEHVEHQPIVNSSEPCICLVATEEPTQFKGIVSRLMQPFVGI
ncbi:MAG: ChrR family anti-sigma-E factor [Alphaproteobacteria bacterium]|nr:ChrR family anti-sigma-E factor [Alphaproteobacteria bacterium]